MCVGFHHQLITAKLFPPVSFFLLSVRLSFIEQGWERHAVSNLERNVKSTSTNPGVTQVPMQCYETLCPPMTTG